MIYKVVFKKEETTGIHITETKFKGISRVCTSGGNGVTFFDSEGEVLTFIPNESLLYIERVIPVTKDAASLATKIALSWKDIKDEQMEQLAMDISKRVRRNVCSELPML